MTRTLHLYFHFSRARILSFSLRRCWSRAGDPGSSSSPSLPISSAHLGPHHNLLLVPILRSLPAILLSTTLPVISASSDLLLKSALLRPPSIFYAHRTFYSFYMHGRSRLFPHDRRHLPACTLLSVPGYIRPATDRTRLEPILHRLRLRVDRLRCRLPHLLCDRQRNQPAHHGRRRRRAADNMEWYVSIRALSLIAFASRPPMPFPDAVCERVSPSLRLPPFRASRCQRVPATRTRQATVSSRAADTMMRMPLGVRGLADNDLLVTRGHISSEADCRSASRSSAHFHRMSRECTSERPRPESERAFPAPPPSVTALIPSAVVLSCARLHIDDRCMGIHMFAAPSLFPRCASLNDGLPLFDMRVRYGRCWAGGARQI